MQDLYVFLVFKHICVLKLEKMSETMSKPSGSATAEGRGDNLLPEGHRFEYLDRLL